LPRQEVLHANQFGIAEADLGRFDTLGPGYLDAASEVVDGKAMSRFRRYALYYAPPLDAAWTATATAWLGWDVNTGEKIEHPAWPGLPLSLPEITKSPRKYGLHATVKPPFFLREGRSAEELTTACEELCQKLAPVR